MGKIPEWAWTAGRWADRSRWTFAGFYALVTFVLLAVAIVALHLFGPAEDRLPLQGLMASLGVAAAASVAFWSLMALGNGIAERRGTAITSGTTPEEAAKLFARMFRPMSGRGLFLLGLVVGGSWFVLRFSGDMAGLGRSLTESLLLTGAVLVTWQFPRWAAVSRESRWLRRLVLGALALGSAWFMVRQFTNVLGPAGGVMRSLADGGLTAVVALGLGLSLRWMHRVTLQTVTRAIRTKDRSLELARDDAPVDRAVRDLLATSQGTRSAMEWGRSLLQRLPPDPATDRALSFLEEAIRRTRGDGH